MTGVAWESRPAARLARDLHTGPGAAPLTRAASAWSGLADEFAAVDAELGKVLGVLADAWRSSSSPRAHADLTAVRRWYAEVAERIAELSVSASAQASTVTVARTLMPHPSDTDAAQQHRALAFSADPLAALLGAAGLAEWATEQQRIVAARVMRGYEAAADQLLPPPVAMPTPPAFAASSNAGDKPNGVASATSTAAVPTLAGASGGVMSPVIPPRAPAGRAASHTLAGTDGDHGAKATPAGVIDADHGVSTSRSSTAGAPVAPVGHGQSGTERVTVRTGMQVDAADSAGVLPDRPRPETWAQVADADVAFADHVPTTSADAVPTDIDRESEYLRLESTPRVST